jgi:hypothetical protein
MLQDRLTLFHQRHLCEVVCPIADVRRGIMKSGFLLAPTFELAGSPAVTYMRADEPSGCRKMTNPLATLPTRSAVATMG